MTNATSLEVRTGYFALCFRQSGEEWTCGDDPSTLTKQFHPDDDPFNLIWQTADFKDTIVFYGLIVATIVLLVIVICLLATFHGWHEEVDDNASEMDDNGSVMNNNGSDMSVKPLPSRPILVSAIIIPIFAPALALLSMVWQHVASVTFVTAMQNMTYGGVKGKVGIVGLTLGWIAVASMMLVSAGLVVLYRAIRLLDRLGDD